MKARWTMALPIAFAAGLAAPALADVPTGPSSGNASAVGVGPDTSVGVGTDTSVGVGVGTTVGSSAAGADTSIGVGATTGATGSTMTSTSTFGASTGTEGAGGSDSGGPTVHPTTGIVCTTSPGDQALQGGGIALFFAGVALFGVVRGRLKDPEKRR